MSMPTVVVLRKPASEFGEVSALHRQRIQNRCRAVEATECDKATKLTPN